MITTLQTSLFIRFNERVHRLWNSLSRHEIFLLASSLAYTTALALAPFIVILLSVVALFGDETQARFVQQLTSVMGPESGAAVKMVIDNADHHTHFAGISGALSFVVLAISASAIFSQLRTVLDKVNEHRSLPDQGGIWTFFREKFLSIGLVLGFVFLLVASLFVSATIAVLFQGEGTWLFEALNIVVSLAIFTLLFTAMYRFIPTDRMTWRRCFTSGAIGSVFYMLGKSVIGLYLGRSALGSAYGAAGSLVVFLAWVYYTTVTLLISYEVTNDLILKEDL